MADIVNSKKVGSKKVSSNKVECYLKEHLDDKGIKNDEVRAAATNYVKELITDNDCEETEINSFLEGYVNGYTNCLTTHGL